MNLSFFRVRQQQQIWHMDKLVTDAYDTEILYLCNADDLVSHPFDITTLFMPHDRIGKPSVWDFNSGNVIWMIQ